jgi:hypothetical protein
LNRADYIEKCERTINPADFNLVRKDPLSQWVKKVDSFIKLGTTKGFWPKGVEKWLTVVNPRVPILYRLPKIHKKGHPMRPVVSSIDCPTSNLEFYYSIGRAGFGRKLFLF